MQKFLYLFAYQTPKELYHRKRYGVGGGQDTMAFFVMADNKEAALAWGEKLAQKYVDVLFANPDVQDKIMEKIRRYQGWIADVQEWEAWQLEKIITVREGDYPDITALVKEKYGPGPY